MNYIFISDDKNNVRPVLIPQDMNPEISVDWPVMDALERWFPVALVAFFVLCAVVDYVG